MNAPSTAGPGALTRVAELVLALCALLLLPLALVGPSLLPGARFLPLAPVAFEPLAAEHPAAAEAAWRGANFLASDALFPVLSDAVAMRAALARGELPLWDSRAGLGAPLFAQSMFGALYPPHWLAFVLPPDVALGWIALFDLFLAGLGLYLFARRVGLAFGAALAGAAVFQTAGFASANLHDLMKFEAGLWLPWMLLAIESALGGRRGAELALAGCTALAQLAGFPPVAVFAGAAAALYAVARGLEQRRPPGRIAGLMLALALGAGLASVQWVPMREAHAESTRGARADPVRAEDGAPLAAALTLVAPELFGRADEPVFAPSNASAWWLARAGERELAWNANPLEWNFFAGALALALAAAAALARPRAAAFPLALALLGLGFAQGWPGVAALRAVPGLDLGSPARAGVLCWTAWAWLAALGADAVLARERRAVAAPIFAGALALAALAFALAFDGARWSAELCGELAARFGVSRELAEELLPPEERARAAQRILASAQLVAAFAGLAAAATLGLALRRGAAPRAPGWIALFLVAAAEGAWYARAHLAPRRTGVELLPPSPALEAVRAAAGDGRVLRLDESESGIGDVLDLARPNLPAAYGVADLSPYVVFTPRRSVELWGAADPRSAWRNGASRVSSVELIDHPALDVLRVTAVLARRPLEHPRLELAYAKDGFCVHRRTGVPPRVRIVHATLAAPTESAALGSLAARQTDPARTTVLPPGAPSWECDAPAPGESAEIELDSANRVVVRVRGASRGWLVLADAWYPGWRAELDGREAEILPVDHALRGVALPAGDHELELVYAPRSLRLGAALSALCLGVVLVLAARGRARAVS